MAMGTLMWLIGEWCNVSRMRRSECNSKNAVLVMGTEKLVVFQES